MYYSSLTMTGATLFGTMTPSSPDIATIPLILWSGKGRSFNALAADTPEGDRSGGRSSIVPLDLVSSTLIIIALDTRLNEVIFNANTS
jgi:hypothetical protein